MGFENNSREFRFRFSREMILILLGFLEVIKGCIIFVRTKDKSKK